MAHPDDAELWAGGVLAQYADVGEAHILVATADDQRGQEAAAGAKVLGADLHLVEEHTQFAIEERLAELRPEVVITHRLDDVHPDHRAVNDLVLHALPEAVITTGRPLRVYTCDTYNSLTLEGRVPGTVVVDISNVYDRKIDALKVHRSQPLDHFATMADRLSAFWGGTRGCMRAEAFDPVPVLGRLPAADGL
ncbi:MAG: PIG-L family deacetylase [Actinomycetota bacterium]|nr:PIG-L family deacetylase [Actinomycetota bacterium]